MFPKRGWFLLALLLGFIGLMVWLGPFERTLGGNVRVVYLHGAWVWTALIGFGAAAAAGAIGLILQKRDWLRYSKALGQSGAFFWLTYLPLSLWAMQTNWNGLFLLEPRWRLAIQFALVALLLQSAIFILDSPRLTGLINIGYFSGLLWALNRTEQVMHPPSPIFNSGSSRIQFYFLLLLLLCLLAGGLISRGLLSLQAGE